MTEWRKVLPISLLAGLCGLIGGSWVWWLASGAGYELFPAAAALAAWGTTAFFWWLIVVRRNNYTLKAGLLAGGLSGLVSHWLCWYLLIVGANGCYWLTGGCASSLGEPPIDPLNGVWGALAFSLLSLLFVGWVTVPLGMLVGAAWVWRQR
ncbi:MAG: hypothetical protein KDF65_16450 [Anaerolineae bacterium]|nr:hypothetical protein [Anaerolineae bacterium]